MVKGFVHLDFISCISLFRKDKLHLLYLLESDRPQHFPCPLSLLCACISLVGLSSPLRDLSSWAYKQCQPPSCQPVSYHHNNGDSGHTFLCSGRPGVYLPAGLAQPRLQHRGWSHSHLHSGYQLHALCASGRSKTTRDIHTRCMKKMSSCKGLEKSTGFLFFNFGNNSDICFFPVKTQTLS